MKSTYMMSRTVILYCNPACQRGCRKRPRPHKAPLPRLTTTNVTPGNFSTKETRPQGRLQPPENATERGWLTSPHSTREAQQPVPAKARLTFRFDGRYGEHALPPGPG